MRINHTAGRFPMATLFIAERDGDEAGAKYQVGLQAKLGNKMVLREAAEYVRRCVATEGHPQHYEEIFG